MTLSDLLSALLWQSTAWLVAGLVMALAFSARPSRGHRLLVLALSGAILAPALSLACKAAGWGLFAPPAAPVASAEPPPVTALTPGATGFDLPLLALATGAWAVLSALLLLRLGVSVVRARRLATGGCVWPEDALPDAVRRACDKLGVRETPELVESPGVRGPMIWCWGTRPRIVMPPPANPPDPLPDDRLFDVLCHELAHWRRRDHLWALAADVAVCVLPWHPLAWIARRRLRDLSEQACDGWALTAGATPRRYAETLLALVPSPGPMVLAAVTSRRGLAGRIDRILRGKPPASPVSGRWFSTVATAAAVLLAATVALAHPRTHAAETPLIVSITAEPPVSAAAHVGTPPANDLPAHPVTVTPHELDLGRCAPDETLAGSVWLVNTSSAPSRVVNAKASCGCTTVGGFESTWLPPGASMKVDLAMTAPKQFGEKKTKHVTFTVDGQPPLKVPIHLETVPAPG